MKILILNGPNLNLLGTREPEIYGEHTLSDLEKLCRDKAEALDWDVDFKQTNHEGQLVEWVQSALKGYDGLIINAAAYTHTSIALHDALKALSIPIIEVHISDPKKREEFRHISYVEPLASDVIVGQGVQGYILALEKLHEVL